MICVIGSGPAGAACASALAKKGCRVTILDAGLQLEASKRTLVERLRNLKSWTKDDVYAMKGDGSTTTKGIPLKLLFGSDFPYREAETHLPMQAEGIGLQPSFALGGLSNVWGAAILPYNDRDLADWPLKSADLAPHYAAVAALTRISGAHDTLEKLCPLYTETPESLKLSRQADAFLRDLEKCATKLERAGIVFGKSRLAVAADPATPNSCVYCGMCMHGCVYDSIYNSAFTIRELVRSGSVDYHAGIVVTRLSEKNGAVKIHGYQRDSGEHFEIEAVRVFLATGVLPTTKILLESLGAFDRWLTIHDSQYFLFPLLRFARTRGVALEKLNTLSQVFLEIIDPSITLSTVHLQIYSFNNLIPHAIASSFGSLRHVLGVFIENLTERMLIAQGYLHSDLSATISVALRKPAAREAPRLDLKLRLNALTRPAIGRIVRKLVRHARSLRALPLAQMLKVAEPGRGFHSGGTFPMRTNPSEFECDIAGRPLGFDKVHVVDASVFPSIPATTITFSVMANAHRIGSMFVEE